MTQAGESGRDSQRVIGTLQRRRRTLPRWERAHATYHVRTSVHPERTERLTQPEIGKTVSETLEYDDGRRYRLHCYVLMPDHLHMLLHPLQRGGGSIPITEIMKTLKGVSARRINRANGLGGSFWLDQSYTRIIRCEKEYRETWHYIRSNPVRAGFVERPEQWRWWWERAR